MHPQAGAAAVASTSEGAAGTDIEEVWENQRFYGIWNAPSYVERPPWSDAAGESVQLPPESLPPAAPCEWELVVSPSTDAQGWQYGTVFRCGSK